MYKILLCKEVTILIQKLEQGQYNWYIFKKPLYKKKTLIICVLI